jgi:hypothetical protein
MVHASIARKTGIGVAVATLLLAGVLSAAAFAGGGGITEPQVIELVTSGCATDDDDPATHCRVFNLRDTEGQLSGEIFRFRVPLSDVDGNPVGRAYLQCDGAKSTGQTCTLILKLKAGPHTESGTIVSMGPQAFPPVAVTGGSGAYLNVRGEMTGEEQSDGFHIFVNLIP